MQQQSNTYIIAFTLGLCVVLGGALSWAATALKPLQQAAVALDTKKQILGAVIDDLSQIDVSTTYDARITSLVVNAKGEEVANDAEGNPLVAEKVNIAKEFKKPAAERLLPVFCLKSEVDPTKIEAYILPMFGNGLWNNIWGFVALEPDLNTVKGASFDHTGETPGLGARITTKEVQNRYKGKKIKDGSGNLVAVQMVKGENNAGLNDNQVDGMSGATITGNGVNIMLTEYLGYYQPYFTKLQGGKQQAFAR